MSNTDDVTNSKDNEKDARTQKKSFTSLPWTPQQLYNQTEQRSKYQPPINSEEGEQPTVVDPSTPITAQQSRDQRRRQNVDNQDKKRNR